MVNILLTGGAGYIGSQIVKQLLAKGVRPVVYDNLSTGTSAALPKEVPLIVGELSDIDALKKVFIEHAIDSVIHLAASISAPQSILKPLDYYENNVTPTIILLKVCAEFKVKSFIFSSTAAVYGNAYSHPVKEDSMLQPLSPYAKSKQMCEQIIADICSAHNINYACLRYFNVAGADPDGSLGPYITEPEHLIRLCCFAALGRLQEITIYGVDHATEDGSCVRDYIHVQDLAEVHWHMLSYLDKGAGAGTYNVGYGQGFSVKEVVNTVQQFATQRFRVNFSNPRPGDPPLPPPYVVADNTKLTTAFNWRPKYNDLRIIVQHALAWEQALEHQLSDSA